MNWFDENELPNITDINSLEQAMGAVKARFNGHPHKFTRNDYLLFINTLYSIFTYLIQNYGKLSKDIKSEYKPNVGFVPLNDVFTEGMDLTDVVEKIFLNPNPFIDQLSTPQIEEENCKEGYKEILINCPYSNSNVYYTIDGTDIQYDSFYNVTNGTLLIQGSDYHGYISITSDCILKLIALPKPGCNLAPSLQAEYNLYYDCTHVEKPIIIEGGIDPVNKTYTEYNVFNEPINTIVIQEGTAVPDLTSFCLQHEVQTTQRLVSGECYVVVPKNKEFTLYVPNNSQNINIIYSELGLDGWPQSLVFTKNYFNYFVKSGEDVIDGVQYNIYKYNNSNGDIFFKIIN